MIGVVIPIRPSLVAGVTDRLGFGGFSSDAWGVLCATWDRATGWFFFHHFLLWKIIPITATRNEGTPIDIPIISLAPRLVPVPAEDPPVEAGEDVASGEPGGGGSWRWLNSHYLKAKSAVILICGCMTRRY